MAELSQSEPGIAEPILHVDMDAFFVEVERLDDPSLIGVPVAVGGDAARGVVASASYEARAMGVRSAMPMTMAKRACPSLRVAPSRHARYREVSRSVFEIFRSFTPLVQGLSLDEAFLDVSGLRRHHADATEVAEQIRTEIRESLHLPASVGAATTMFLAKLASERAKPDGIFVIETGSELTFLHELPVDALWGVGEATRASLESLGLETVGDIASTPEATLRRRLGDSVGIHLRTLALGIDDRSVTPDGEAKSISAEQTYGVDISGRDTIAAELLRHSERVGWRLRRADVAGLTVTIKVRYDDFTTVTRSITLESATDVGRDIYQAVQLLLDRVELEERAVRLLGVGVSGLTDSGGPRQLATDREARWDELADAVHGARERFGHDAVEPAALRDAPAAPSTGNETAHGAYNDDD